MGEGEVGRLVLTDEPYNVPIGGNVTKGLSPPPRRCHAN
jgi:hypothetical protein